MTDLATLGTAIANGELDDHLPQIQQLVVERTKKVRQLRALQIEKGGQAKTVNIKPKYLSNLVVEVVSIDLDRAMVRLGELDRFSVNPRYLTGENRDCINVPLTCLEPV